MHRMSGWGPVVQNDPDGLGGSAIVDVPVRGVAEVACVGEQQERRVEVGAKGDGVHHPQPVAGGVLAEGDVDLVGDVRHGGGCDLENRSGELQGVVGLGAVGDGVWLRRRCGHLTRVRSGVVDGCHGIGLAGRRAAGLDRGTHEVGSICESVGGDDDIDALSNAERDHGDGVGLDRDKVVGDDCEVVSVDRELLLALGTGVDEAQPVLLSCLETELTDTGVFAARLGGPGTVEVHLAVDQIVLRRACGQNCGEVGAHDIRHDIEILAVVPVREEDRASVDVVVLAALEVVGPVDDHGAQKTAGVLPGVMRMPPLSTVLLATSSHEISFGTYRCAIEISTESVSERSAGGNRTLLFQYQYHVNSLMVVGNT